VPFDVLLEPSAEKQPLGAATVEATPPLESAPDAADVEDELFDASFEGAMETIATGNADDGVTADRGQDRRLAWGSSAYSQANALGSLSDPLTGLRSLSDDERIALFT